MGIGSKLLLLFLKQRPRVERAVIKSILYRLRLAFGGRGFHFGVWLQVWRCASCCNGPDHRRSTPQLSFLHGLAMAFIVVIAFYYSDLYAIDQTLSRARTVASLRGWIRHGLYRHRHHQLSDSELWQIDLCKRDACDGIFAGVMALRFHEGNQASEYSSQGLDHRDPRHRKNGCRRTLSKKKLGMEVIGFVSERAGRVTLTYGNPKKVEIPIFAPPSLVGLVASSHVNRILLAGADLSPHSYFKELVSVRALGVPIEDCHSFYERLTSKIAITDLPPEWIALSKGFRRDRLILAAKRIIDVVVSFIGLILSAPLILLTVIAIKLESPGADFLPAGACRAK